MGVEGRRFLVIYESETGKVRGVKMTGDIRHRVELERACGGGDLPRLGFTRELRGVEVDVENDIVKSVINGEPKMLFGKDGMAKFQRVSISESRERVLNSEGVYIVSRPGIGDFILAAECVAGMRQVYPGKTIVLNGPGGFKKLCEHFEPGVEFAKEWGEGKGFEKFYYVDQRIGYQFDPRGGLHGHVSKYGVYLGVDDLKGEVKLRWEPGERMEYLRGLGIGEGELEGPVLGIHIKSASSATRSWLKHEAGVLAMMWKSVFKGSVFLFGERKDYGVSGEGFWFIGAEEEVMAGAAAVGICSIVVCIDSGPLHLARIQGVKYICLWGGTRPGIVLGREVNEYDIVGDVGCGFEACHTCGRKRAECMESIKAEAVWEKIKGVMDE